MTAMGRNWLASVELPAKFWYYAVKHAAEVLNYYPIKLEDDTWSTPLELAHGIKPDLRVLFKVFGLAAVCRERNGDCRVGKFDKFQLNTTSGAYFGYKYQAGTFFYRLDETTSIFSPKYALDTSVYIHTHSPPSIATIIGIPTYKNPKRWIFI